MRSIAALSAALLLSPLASSAPARADEPAPQATGSLPSEPSPGATPEAAPSAPSEEAQQDPRAELEASLSFKTGEITLGDKLATLHLKDGQRYLSAADTEKVLVAWGNPPGSETLGMVVPTQESVFADASWAVIVTYTEDGHVDDEDAKDLDFNELLDEMKEDTEEGNSQRKEAGYPAVHLLKWAEPPHYDASTRKVYWAKELSFEGSDAHTLNYDIRVLGRKGVLELSAVAAVDQLAMVKAAMPSVLSAVEFNPGQRYADFNPGVDKMAAYGIGALVAGKLAAKAGLFKIIVAALLASKKLLVAAGAGVVLAVKKLLGGKTESPEPPANG
ncbi:MAG: DUF2167 domain-containing protein [Myxococcales bacterium]